jgi:hypothetical protein
MRDEIKLSTKTSTHNTKNRTHTFKFLNTILITIFLTLALDQICSQAQILTSLLIYGAKGMRAVLSNASTRACASLPEGVSTAGFRNVALL